MFRGAVGV